MHQANDEAFIAVRQLRSSFCYLFLRKSIALIPTFPVPLWDEIIGANRWKCFWLHDTVNTGSFLLLFYFFFLLHYLYKVGLGEQARHLLPSRFLERFKIKKKKISIANTNTEVNFFKSSSVLSTPGWSINIVVSGLNVSLYVNRMPPLTQSASPWKKSLWYTWMWEQTRNKRDYMACN